MRICVFSTEQSQDNVVSNLAAGVCKGLRLLGKDPTLLVGPQRGTGRWIGSTGIPRATDWLILPHWVSEHVWSLNLTEVKRARPGLRIAVYSALPLLAPWTPVSYDSASQCLDTSRLLGA